MLGPDEGREGRGFCFKWRRRSKICPAYEIGPRAGRYSDEPNRHWLSGVWKLCDACAAPATAGDVTDGNSSRANNNVIEQTPDRRDYTYAHLSAISTLEYTTIYYQFV